MLLVNFDKEIDEEKLIELCAQKKLVYKETIDFSGQMKSFKVFKSNVSYSNEFDKNSKIHEKAIHNYVEEVSKISSAELVGGDTIREYSSMDFPIYWLTNLSLKHAQNSILKNYFYLLELIKSGRIESSLYNDICLILPGREFYFKGIFERKLKELSFKNPTCISLGETKALYSSWGIFSFFIQQTKEYFQAKKKISTILKGYVNSNVEISVFTFPLETWRPEAQNDYVFKELFQSLKISRKVSYIPMITDLGSFNVNYEWDNAWDKKILNSFPGPISFFSNLIGQYKILNQIKRMRLTNDTKQELFVDENVLKRELTDVIYLNHGLIFFYMWLKKYFKTIDNSNVLIYQDEFYKSGRVISHAKNRSKNKMLKTVGVQHGLFFEGHTVYAITKNEVSGTNSMPIPDKFVVWGDMFKRTFLRTSPMPDSYVVVSGNLKYIGLSNVNLNSGETNKTILWCTTLESDTRSMFECISPSFDLFKEYTLMVRCHPLINISSKIKELLEATGLKEFVFSHSESVLDDIKKSDVVISSNASTTFIDGIASNKPVININLPDYYLNNQNCNNLYNVTHADDFRECLKKLLLPESMKKDSNINEFSSDQNNWELILTHQL